MDRMVRARTACNAVDELSSKPEPENPGGRLSGKTGVMRTFPSLPPIALGTQLMLFIVAKVRIRRASGGLPDPLRQSRTVFNTPGRTQVPEFS